MLPIVNNLEQFNSLDLRDPSFALAACTVLSHSNLAEINTSHPTTGSLPVVFINDQAVMKFFPPLFTDAFQNEVKSLQFLSNCQVPKLLEVGEIHGWHYVLMSKLAGNSLKDIWESLPQKEKSAACREVGASLRRIHEIKLTADFDLSSWTQFLDSQKQGCFARHEKLGLRQDLLKQIPKFIESVDLVSSRICFLHTEVMKDHVFFDRSSGKISFSGLIDFEPSMVGTYEYDFASIGIFLSSGDRVALRSFFEGYGNLDQAVNREFRRRVMAYTLLHKYSNLKWYLQFMPNADSLDDLADLWWAV